MHEVFEELHYRVSAVANIPAAEKALSEEDVDVLLIEHRRGGDTAELAAFADFKSPCVVLSSAETRSSQDVVRAVTETLKRDPGGAVG